MEDIFTFYPLVTILLTLVWILLFIRAKDVRREMLILGVFSLFIMPVATIVASRGEDVTNALVSLTFFDLLLIFVVAGIAGAIYHCALGKKYHRILPKQTKQKEQTAQLWLMKLFVTLLLFVWGVVLLSALFSLPSSIAVLIASIILGIYIVAHRHDLLNDVVWSGILTAAIVFFASALVSTVSGAMPLFSLVEHTTMIGPIPLDLLLWSLALGFAAGPVYEYTRHLELK